MGGGIDPEITHPGVVSYVLLYLTVNECFVLPQGVVNRPRRRSSVGLG